MEVKATISTFTHHSTIILSSLISYYALLPWTLRRATQEVLSLKDGISMSGGDWGSLAQLFFDNLSTLLGALYAIQALGSTTSFGDIAVSQDVMNEVIWNKIAVSV